MIVLAALSIVCVYVFFERWAVIRKAEKARHVLFAHVPCRKAGVERGRKKQKHRIAQQRDRKPRRRRERICHARYSRFHEYIMAGLPRRLQHSKR